MTGWTYLKLALATVSHADVINEEKLDFDKTDVITLFKKKIYNFNRCVRIKSNILR